MKACAQSGVVCAVFLDAQHRARADRDFGLLGFACRDDDPVLACGQDRGSAIPALRCVGVICRRSQCCTLAPELSTGERQSL